jgi:DNA-binding CsgD family transcriptional regulator
MGSLRSAMAMVLGMAVPSRVTAQNGLQVTPVTNDDGTNASTSYHWQLCNRQAGRRQGAVSAGARAWDDEHRGAGLTPRECEVLAWVAQGKSAWEIGEILHIAKRTVHEHIQTAVRKLGACNRVHAVVIALRDGIIEF